MSRRPLIWTGMDTADVDWGDSVEAAADVEAVEVPAAALPEPAVDAERKAIEERRERIRRVKSRDWSSRSSAEIRERWGQAALDWIESEWAAGRAVKVGSQRWNTPQETLERFESIRLENVSHVDRGQI